MSDPMASVTTPPSTNPERAITVTMEWIPSLTVNHRYWHARGRVILKPAVKAWMDALAWEIKNQRVDARGVLTEYAPDQNFNIAVDYYLMAQGGDADNYLKSIWDGVKLGLGVDDKHFRPGDSRVHRVTKKYEQRFVITITPL